jgi:saxitoxin biosynthesis operon SxtJ-like protein
MNTHEPAISYRKTVRGSNRSFGIVFTVVFAMMGLAPLIAGHAIRVWSLALAAVFLAIALLMPAVLSPLNRLWLQLGLLLHRLVNPVVMAMMYFGAIVPMGLLLRILGKDLLRLRLDPQATTYWIARQPAGPKPESMSKQF